MAFVLSPGMIFRLKIFGVTSGRVLETRVFIGFAVRQGPRHYRGSDALKKGDAEAIRRKRQREIGQLRQSSVFKGWDFVGQVGR
jgi:hypothetical protein